MTASSLLMRMVDHRAPLGAWAASSRCAVRVHGHIASRCDANAVLTLPRACDTGDGPAVAEAVKAESRLLASQVAMHVAAMQPKYLSVDDIPPAVAEAERAAFEAQVRAMCFSALGLTVQLMS